MLAEHVTILIGISSTIKRHTIFHYASDVVFQNFITHETSKQFDSIKKPQKYKYQHSLLQVVWLFDFMNGKKENRNQFVSQTHLAFLCLGLITLEIRKLVTSKHKRDVLLRSALFLGNRLTVLGFYGIFF